MRDWLAVGLVMGVLGLALGTPAARATVEMQNQAKKLGFPLKNCVYCHASPHAVEKMKETARELNMSDGNCLQCHGADIPTTLNDRGRWLVAEKKRRKADEFDMAWLNDYEEPDDEETPAPETPPE
jgi:mono/diheme cytochrome c family protein